MKKNALFLMLSFLVLSTACRFGEAEFGTDLQQTAFTPNGTVYSYADVHGEGDASSARPQLNVVMSWLIFDPNSDLNDRSGNELENMRHEMELRDNLLISFKDQAEVVSGAVFDEQIIPSTDENTPFMPKNVNVQLHFAKQRLSLSSLFDEQAVYGSIKKVHIKIERTQFTKDTKSGISGHISIDFSRNETDPANARIGRIEGDFIAPWVSETHAEHNLEILKFEEKLGFKLVHKWDQSETED